MKIGLISDTHIPGRARSIPSGVFEIFEGVDLILHAGDLLTDSVLDELQAIAPSRAVFGNGDDPSLAAVLPETLLVDSGGVSIAMIHDSGPAQGRRDRLLKKFPTARVVVFGHSHRPLIDETPGFTIVNPGSATDPRAAKTPTVGVLEIIDGIPRAVLVQI